MRNVKTTRRVLVSFIAYLDQHQIPISDLKIEHIDAFQSAFLKPFSTMTRRIYGSKLRDFLSFLFDEQVTRKNLSYGIVAARRFEGGGDVAEHRGALSSEPGVFLALRRCPFHTIRFQRDYASIFPRP